MIETIKLTVKLSNFSKINRLNKIITLFLLIYIGGFSAYILVTYPALQVQNNLYGLITDLVNFVVIIFLFWMVQCSELSQRAYLFSAFGLMLWAMGATADVLDELVVQPYWISVYFEDMCRTTGMLLTSYGLFKAMRFVQSIHNRLASELVIDDLTQIHNRRYFYQHAKNTEAASYAILIVDIDHFKSINDDFGHDIGDLVLKELATKFSQKFEGENFFSRLGGEEFGGYLSANNMAQVSVFSQQLIELAHTLKIKNTRQLTVSIGVALKAPGEPLDKVMKRADEALYLAKKSGRDRFEIAL